MFLRKVISHLGQKIAFIIGRTQLSGKVLRWQSIAILIGIVLVSVKSGLFFNILRIIILVLSLFEHEMLNCKANLVYPGPNFPGEAIISKSQAKQM